MFGVGYADLGECRCREGLSVFNTDQAFTNCTFGWR